jgi:hypothetical protein
MTGEERSRSRSRGQERTLEVVGLREEGLQSSRFLPMESCSRRRTIEVVLILGQQEQYL